MRIISDQNHKVIINTMTSYTYDTLPSFHTPTIHILTLFAGTGNDPLHGTIETCLFDETSPPEYEALSYCWRPPALDAVIDCSRGFLGITTMLDSALRVLRYPEDKSRRL